MQSHVVMAFRKRMKSFGYTEISIVMKRNDKGEKQRFLYTVTAREPLAKTLVSAEYSTTKMNFTFR